MLAISDWRAVRFCLCKFASVACMSDEYMYIRKRGQCMACMCDHQRKAGCVQVLTACQTASLLQLAQDSQAHPRWLADAETPVLIGGFAAVIMAYCISMYTVYHVAKAYKRLELRVRLPPRLWGMWA